MYAPSARTRAAPVKVRWMMLITWGTIRAAPAPCASRNPISASALGARPQASDEKVKTTSPIRKTRLKPSRSPSRAPVIRSTA